MKRTFAATAVAALMSTGAAFAQDYPTGTVTIVVPYSPAGSTDPAARFIAGELQEKWGVNVTVENRPGAGATIGTAHVATTPADGYTILLTTSAYTTAPAVHDDLPYDPVNDLRAVAMPSSAQFVVTAGASVESETLSEFLENEAAEREIFLATAGLGSSTHFAGELLAAATGMNAVPVHYSGGSDAMVDLIGGRADIYVGSMTAVLSNVQAGQIKALGVFGADRARALPDTPSTEELGIEGASSGFWLGVFAPAGTPEEIITKLNEDITAVMTSDAGTAYLENLDSNVGTMSAAEFQAMVEAEIEQWKVLAAERGIAAD
ncbi:Bug family tripartite tricarboxylate transporter substrate binding protein [Alkalilacustris brevis]|uniref:Bug family tripartite tricarboxylate transporter substrate binding protein n=1 Tax=Alkalilacustris brevis TaxID=2026338 RepID=UPI0013904510|nr:tripartite tricarboxylate transporter substrate binding protein [Alkalilacustris brevis]